MLFFWLLSPSFFHSTLYNYLLCTLYVQASITIKNNKKKIIIILGGI